MIIQPKGYEITIDSRYISHHIQSGMSITECNLCSCEKSLHHAYQKQKADDGTSYIRTCYGIGCICEEVYPHFICSYQFIYKQAHWYIGKAPEYFPPSSPFPCVRDKYLYLYFNDKGNEIRINT